MDRLGDYLLGPNDTPENGIYAGDCRDLAKAIPDESVDLIFTDPVYDRIDDYRWLAKTAVRVLRSDSACLAWCSKVKIPDCQKAMGESLEYQTTLFYTVNGKQARPIFAYGVIPWTTPCLVFASGRYKCSPFIPDTFITMGWELAATGFKWQKNPGVINKWMHSFSTPDSVVLDFYCGLGVVPAVCKMLGRRWLAFEIEPDTAEMARKRVRETQPPLFVPQMEQAALFE